MRHAGRDDAPPGVDHPLYSVWRSMIDRCTNPNSKPWLDYGGRGIIVCERWVASFPNFVADMGERPPGMTLDRFPNNDGNYEPGNCRWATRREQQRNQRITRKIQIDGREYVAADLAERSGLKTDTIVKRARAGLSLAEVLAPDRRVFTQGLRFGGPASGARRKLRTHCANGHEFSDSNTLITKQGWRCCRRCHANRQYERNHAQAGG